MKKPKLRIPTTDGRVTKGTIVFKDKSKYDRKRDKKVSDDE